MSLMTLLVAVAVRAMTGTPGHTFACRKRAWLMLPHKATTTGEMLLPIEQLRCCADENVESACRACCRQCVDNDMTPWHKKACCSGFFMLAWSFLFQWHAAWANVDTCH